MPVLSKTAFSTVIKTMRPPFLVLAPICILLGFATSLAEGNDIDVQALLLVLACALLAHISVNTLNEYQDFVSGLDAKTVRTPFSGGSGALIEHPEFASLVRAVAISSLALTVLIGAYFVHYRGLVLLLIGIAGVAIIISYTKWLNRQAWLCLLAPGAAFGLLMVNGSYLVLSGGLSLRALCLSLVPFFLVNNLLLLNQIPDIDADRSIGRRHFPIAFSAAKSLWVYGLFSVLTAAVIVLAKLMHFIPSLALASLAPLLLTPVVVTKLARIPLDSAPADELHAALGSNVVVCLATPCLLSLGIIFG